MDSNELREHYLQFFEQRGHRVIPSAPLVPENDPTVLFTTAGMHPLVPYLLGEPHPLGRRLVGFQKCLRTNDIDEVGDTSHLTFFEMLGNWSLGDYFKDDALSMSYEFLTHELGIDPGRLAVTVFAGDADAPRDEDSADIWRKLGIPESRIFFLPKSENWWGPIGTSGPCGPDSEIFFDTRRPDHPGCRPGCPCGKWLEIWNNVFMAYEKHPNGSYTPLKQANVDTGMGVERTAWVLQNQDDIFAIETLAPLITAVEELSNQRYADHPTPFRVIVDHIRAATFAIADGVQPSNVQAGYVVRRLVRRAVRYGHDLGIPDNFCAQLSGEVVDSMCNVYPGLEAQREAIARTLDQEESDFKKTLRQGLKQAQKVIDQARATGESRVSGQAAFDLFQNFGFPLPLTVDLAHENGLDVDRLAFETAYEQHRQRSRQAAQADFASGLADHSPETIRLHTAAHLLQAALRMVLGPEVHQMGSNINSQRLRFDFSYPTRLTDEQVVEVERLVNQQIALDLPVQREMMSKDEALHRGALAFFIEKYADTVSVYSIGDFSKEVCTGPHVAHTGELGHFKIARQEAVKQGVRRIRGVLD